jgi:hypothetical protein
MRPANQTAKLLQRNRRSHRRGLRLVGGAMGAKWGYRFPEARKCSEGSLVARMQCRGGVGPTPWCLENEAAGGEDVRKHHEEDGT